MTYKQHLYLGRVANVPIVIHASWLLFLPLGVGKLTLNTMDEFNWPFLFGWQAAVLLTLVIALSVVLHEAGHLITAVIRRLPLRQITLYPFGGVPKFGHSPIPAAAFLQMTIAGPLTSLLQAALWASAWLIWDVALLLWVAQFNLLLGLLNLLPAVSLDGGRLLALLTNRFPYGRVKVLVGMLTAAALALGFNLAGGLAFMMGLLFLDLALLIDGALFIGVGLLLGKPREQTAQIYTAHQLQQLAYTQVGQLIGRPVGVLTDGRSSPLAPLTGSLFSADTSGPDVKLGHGRLTTPFLQPGAIDVSTSLTQALQLLDQTTLSHVALVDGYRIIGTLSHKQIIDHLPTQHPPQLPQNLDFYLLLEPNGLPPKVPEIEAKLMKKGILWN